MKKIKQHITDPFWGESTSHWWIPLIPLTMRKAFPYHDVYCLDSFVLCDYDIDVVKAYHYFTPGAFPSTWQQMLQFAYPRWLALSYLYKCIYINVHRTQGYMTYGLHRLWSYLWENIHYLRLDNCDVNVAIQKIVWDWIQFISYWYKK